MAHISVRVPECEKLEIEKYASFCGESISTLVRKLFKEKIEDEEDMKSIHEYENSEDYEKDGIPHDEVWRSLGF